MVLINKQKIQLTFILSFYFYYYYKYNKLKQIKNKQLKIKNSIINNDDLSDIISIPSITATSNDDLLSNDENLNKKINETIQANNLK